jgi:hypothetical protein
MSFELEKVRVPKWAMLVVLIAMVTVAVGVWYYFIDLKSVKAIGVLGGIIAGFLVFLLTFVVSIGPLQRLDGYEKMGIKGILDNRHDKEYYRRILTNVEKLVRVMGASCTRFVDDFLDRDNEDRALVNALRMHPKLIIQILIPDNRKREFLRTFCF